jgi:hypothetical protein
LSRGRLLRDASRHIGGLFPDSPTEPELLASWSAAPQPAETDFSTVHHGPAVHSHPAHPGFPREKPSAVVPLLLVLSKSILFGLLGWSRTSRSKSSGVLVEL